VRDGHYPIWGPLHFYSTIDATSKKPTNPNAANFVGYFDGSVALPGGAKLLDAEIKAHTVPMCAMKVSRNTELGDVAPYTPASGACGCYYDKASGGSTSCATCTVDGDCTGSAKHCNFGYCEAS
jgi:hypothetical protein